MTDGTREDEQTVVIDGVGLIGGSIAAALRRSWPTTRIVGIGRNPARIRKAVVLGMLDEVFADTADLKLEGPVLGVSCLPVALIADSIVRLSNGLPAGSIVTDAGSTKQRICEAVIGRLSESVPYVPAHPIAGREKSGFESALPDLFDGSLCILTPEGLADNPSIERVTHFWTALGCRVTQTSSSEHDRILAMVSHLPHIAAAALAGIAAPSDTQFCGTGFRDTTRIAAGSPGMWLQILMNNQAQVNDAIAALIGQLQHYQSAVLAGDERRLLELLTSAAEVRKQLTD